MSDRQDLTYGPMVAHTTSTTLRIWLRAGIELRGEQANVTCKLIDAATTVVETQSFNFLSDYDFVGLIEFGTVNHLLPNTTYQYVIEYKNKQGQIVQHCTYTAKTFSDDPAADVSFVTGSCRHLHVFGWQDIKNRIQNVKQIFKADKPKNIQYGDLVFQRIDENNKDLELDLNLDFILMTGDQVYADHPKGAFSILPKWLTFLPSSAELMSDFLAHYYQAWDQEYFSGLAHKIPFYMLMDDHEVFNDFSMDMILADIDNNYEKNTIKYNNGLKSYICYQASLSAVIKRPKDLEQEFEALSKTSYELALKAEDVPYKEHSKNLHYKFSHGCAEFYCMNVRTERFLRISNPQMLGQKQMVDLKEWLNTVSVDKVKFIVTAVPIFPDTQGRLGAAHDKWGGFAEQRHEILEYIRHKNIRKVVFLSGDVHVSFVTQLQYNNEDMDVYSVISSAYTWPVPGISRHHFSWDNLAQKSKKVSELFSKKVKKRVPDNDARGGFKPKQISAAWEVHDDPHANNSYCHIKTDGDSFTYSFFSRDKNEMYDGQQINFD